MQEINKTITAEESKINIKGGQHVRIKNYGDGTIYVSKQKNITPGDDNVIEISSGEVDIIEDVCTNSIVDNVMDWYGTIYMISESTSRVAIRTQNHVNFSRFLKGGEYSSSSVDLDTVLKSGTTYQLGILTSDITLTLPESANNDIEVCFAIADTAYSINCEYLSLEVVANTYYQVIFSYDKVLQTWFSSIVSSDYTPVSTTAEVIADETN